MSNPIDKPHDEPVCNLDYLLVNLGRNRTAAERLIRLFIDNHPQLTARLESAAAAGDVPALQDAVHDIRSSCVLFSAHQAVALARELEYALYNQRRGDGAIDWVVRSAALVRALTQVCAELRRHLASTEN